MAKACSTYKTYQCGKCTFKASKPSKLKKHIIRVHDGKGTYNCKICRKKICPTSQYISFHMKKKHNMTMDQYAKEYENEKSSSEAQIPMKDLCKTDNSGDTGDNTINMPTTSQESKNDASQKCKAASPKKFDMKMHFWSVHLKADPVYNCEQCPYHAINKSNLMRHMNEIHGKKAKSYICQKCGSEFTRNWGLVNHDKVVHQKIRDHACEYCDSSFAKKALLRKHIKAIHLEITILVCNYCGLSFKECDELEDHKKRVHENTKDYIVLNTKLAIIIPLPEQNGLFGRPLFLK